MNELERRGFHIGALEQYRGPVTPHRVLTFSQATAIVHLSIGPDIAYWAAKPGVRGSRLLRPAQPPRASGVRPHPRPGRRRPPRARPGGARPRRRFRPVRHHPRSPPAARRPPRVVSPRRHRSPRGRVPCAAVGEGLMRRAADSAATHRAGDRHRLPPPSRRSRAGDPVTSKVDATTTPRAADGRHHRLTRGERVPDAPGVPPVRRGGGDRRGARRGGNHPGPRPALDPDRRRRVLRRPLASTSSGTTSRSSGPGRRRRCRTGRT